MKVKIFTASWCSKCSPYIDRAKKLNNNVEAISIDGMTTEELRGLGFMSVPYTIIEDDDGNVIDKWAGKSMNKLGMYLEG